MNLAEQYRAPVYYDQVKVGDIVMLLEPTLDLDVDTYEIRMIKNHHPEVFNSPCFYCSTDRILLYINGSNNKLFPCCNLQLANQYGVPLRKRI